MNNDDRRETLINFFALSMRNGAKLSKRDYVDEALTEGFSKAEADNMFKLAQQRAYENVPG